MSTFKLQNIEMLHYLWLLPLVVALFFYAAKRRKQALQAMIKSESNLILWASSSATRRFWKAVAVVSALAFLIFALARPAWNPSETTIKRSGRDVVFVLDVSQSMLAQDLAPNRLERAKLAILDTVDRLQGDRVGLVVFAGTAVIKCPLTLDYGFFRMMVEDIAVNMVSRGGTLIGDAVRTVMDQVFDDQLRHYKDIILITDGEDHESFPVDAASAAGKQGIRLIVVGLGDEDEGRRIPVVDEHGRQTFLKYQGREVWTKLDGDTLRQMANSTPGGRYLPVSTGAIDLGDVYMQLVAAAEKKELEAKTVRKYEEKFQIFLAAAFLLLAIEALVSERKQNNGNR